MTAANEAKPAKRTDDNLELDGTDPFRLEGVFEDASQIFKPYRVSKTSSPDVIVAVDTNVLLLPYTIRKDGLPKLQKFYQELRATNRLFLPARVAREFIIHRDKKLAELLKMIGDVKSRINIGETNLSPILRGVEGSAEMSIASEALAEAKKQYTAALEKVERQVESWSGDDPVTSVYDSVFDVENIIAPTQPNEEILAEWKVRLRERIPPGYKDGGKTDTGIGDFLIWKSLLALGAVQKKDMIFVTGEEKADWFVRVNGRGAYPRPELVAEYRKHSGGKNIRLVEFHDVLREMDVAQEVVIEVEKAEITANNVIRATYWADNLRPTINSARASINSAAVGNFRLRYGGEDITFVSEDIIFKFNVSEAGLNAMWVYPNGRDKLYSVPIGTSGQLVDLNGVTAANEAFRVSTGQMACYMDDSGNAIVVRMINANAPENPNFYILNLAFSVSRSGNSIIAP